MSHRRAIAVVATSAVLLTACGGGSEPAQQAASGDTLDAAACSELTEANLNLATAATSEEARKAADVFGKYQPPADTVEAIDHVVQEGGVRFDGSDFDLLNDHVDAWVRQVCPE